MTNFTLDEDYLTLLSFALHQAQKIEFALYSLASFLSNTEEAKKDKRFANLTVKDFLSSDLEKQELRKATLGQLCRLFGEKLLLAGEVLDSFVEKRNIIVHEFYRETFTHYGCYKINNPKVYLLNFIEESRVLEKAISGLFSLAVEAAAKKEGRTNELNITVEDERNRKIYEILVLLNSLKNKKFD